MQNITYSCDFCKKPLVERDATHAHYRLRLELQNPSYTASLHAARIEKGEVPDICASCAKKSVRSLGMVLTIQANGSLAIVEPLCNQDHNACEFDEKGECIFCGQPRDCHPLDCEEHAVIELALGECAPTEAERDDYQTRAPGELPGMVKRLRKLNEELSQQLTATLNTYDTLQGQLKEAKAELSAIRTRDYLGDDDSEAEPVL